MVLSGKQPDQRPAAQGDAIPGERREAALADDAEANEFRHKLGSVTATVDEAMTEIEISATTVDGSKG